VVAPVTAAKIPLPIHDACMMIKPWSISTTVRSPERLRAFLQVLKLQEGEAWNEDAQQKFQIRLIQARVYGAGRAQFHAGLSPEQIELVNSTRDISYGEAEAVFNAKGYEDPPMRGRTSFKPLQKFGFAMLVDGKVKISEAGEQFLSEDADRDIFLRCLLKWQLPNPLDKHGFPQRYGYCIRPFMGVLMLIREVNRLCFDVGEKAKGIGWDEFGIFGLTLTDHKNIDSTARDIMRYRADAAGVPDGLQNLAKKYRPQYNLRHIRDFTDNAIRYFRMTDMISVRGGGRYIDIEPLREAEMKFLADEFSAAPDMNLAMDEKAYSEQLGNPRVPKLPPRDSAALDKAARIRENMQRDMQQREKTQESIVQLIALSKGRDAGLFMKPSVQLEHQATMGLMALDDAVSITPNYPVGSDGLPMSHAPGGKPDIECQYDNFALICEVTLSKSRDQWIQEGQPVMRHLRDFEERHEGKDAFGVFIAPVVHRDTVNTFWASVKHAFEGKAQRIVPLTIAQFCDILAVCADRQGRNNPINKGDLLDLWLSICDEVKRHDDSREWVAQIPLKISQWKEKVLA